MYRKPTTLKLVTEREEGAKGAGILERLKWGGGRGQSGSGRGESAQSHKDNTLSPPRVAASGASSVHWSEEYCLLQRLVGKPQGENA